MSNLNKAQIDHVIILYNECKFQEALDALIMLNNEYPNVPMIFNLLGVCYKSLGKINNALEAFEVASKIKPDYSEAYFNQGVIHQELNSLEKAIYSYKKTIEIMPKNPKAACKYIYGETWSKPLKKNTNYRPEIIKNKPVLIRRSYLGSLTREVKEIFNISRFKKVI